MPAGGYPLVKARLSPSAQHRRDQARGQLLRRRAGARDSDAGQQRQVAVVPGVPRYHTDNCILIRFMDDSDVQLMPLKAATDAGCTPCGACQPGD